ncbi:hypothetical protein A0H81_10968 [Grifola frondosa]|uniref:Arrestin-like N-terminal domain-containing protein n=1 Tax=Grifola frondosa TaxID=5627 RepID=A0A1C7LXV8_GRIFR|nr:hypothetical protein A0H81_10968 [Grifola frondosa]
MAVSIEITTLTDSLDMYGEPDRNAAYALSGHVSLLLSPHLRFLSAELRASFCSHSLLLLRDSDKPCTWNVVFNLTIPGWLPASSSFGDAADGEAGTRYALYATAKFVDADDEIGRPWLSTILCSSLRWQIHSARASRCPVRVNRFIVPRPSHSRLTSVVPTIKFIGSVIQDSTRIPAEVISKLLVLAVVPDSISIDDPSFSLCVRLRTKGLPASECKRLRISDVRIDVEQTEQYRTSPSPSYATQFALPSERDQPPNRPLLCPHPMHTVYDVGFLSSLPPNYVFTRAHSILSDGASSPHVLPGDGYIFADDAEEANANDWYAMQITVPFSKVSTSPNALPDVKSRPLLESATSPLSSVNHRLYVALTCTYDLTEGGTPERISERLDFQIPVRFVRTPPPLSHPITVAQFSHGGHSPSSSIDSCGSGTPLVSSALPDPSTPYAQTLPAYSQLFHMNGDRKIDYSVPLPLYTPRSQPSILASSSLGSLELADDDVGYKYHESVPEVQ